MKRKLFLLPTILLVLPTIASCAKEEFYNLKVYNQDELVLDSHISIFNNAILPEIDPSDYAQGKIFVGFGAEEFVPHVSKKKDFYQQNDLIRLADVKPYAVDHTIVLNTIYCNEGELATSYLVLGWYAKTTTSGLTQEIMDGFTPMLHDYLRTELNATEDQIADTEIRAYNGDVATIGGNIMFDGDVNIFIGASGNLATTGGVTEYARRASFPIAGVTNRYIYLINYSDVSNSTYEYMRSKPVRTYFGG